MIYKLEEMHLCQRGAHAFQVLYIYDYITELCRQQEEAIQNHENANDRNIGKDEARHRK
jgi:hypothetical protein